MTDHEDPPDVDDLIAEEMSDFEPDIRYASSAPIGVQVINWRTLKKADAPAAWNELRSWVEWFTVRYRISESVVPVCWYKHGQLVEELSALHIAHAAAFDSADAGFGPIGWHERLSLSLPRLSRAYAGGCSRGHDPFKPRSWAELVDEQEWNAWTSQAHAN
jgi:hypothetical protein